MKDIKHLDEMIKEINQKEKENDQNKILKEIGEFFYDGDLSELKEIEQFELAQKIFYIFIEGIKIGEPAFFIDEKNIAKGQIMILAKLISVLCGYAFGKRWNMDLAIALLQKKV